MRTAVPDRVRRERGRGLVGSVARDGLRRFGVATAAWRPGPDFLIIGTKRGGSTSVYFDLLAHPAVCRLSPPPVPWIKSEATKGVHYFDVNFDRGPAWYRSYLPTRGARALRTRRAGVPALAGEASPYYLFHPLAPERAAAEVPEAKLVAVLRDPVARTYSHWKERRREGLEELDFADALAAEDDRVGDAEERLRRDPHAVSYAHEHQSYARQSEYVTGLTRWFAGFPAAQLLVLPAEDYYRAPADALDRVQGFLGLPTRDISTGRVLNQTAGGPELDPALRRRLAARFAPHNEALARLTGERFEWS